MSTLFEGDAKGEILQLRDKLDGNDPSERKQAAKRCIALMRSGENVLSLFSSMLRCVKTSDLELKKLTYLYLVQYSSQEPEQAIMAVNTFVQDSQDFNPLVRALAVRTMCRIKLESVAEHMILPLKKCMCDTDPYVRKTAAFSVAKLYEIIPEAVENAQLFTDLLKLLKDENPMVVSNTTATIFEINERRTTPIFQLNADTLSPIISAIPSCSEWCQTILFDSLARYIPVSSEDASFLIDRLIPFLKHSNPAVVIGSFKCIFLFMEKDTREPKDLFPLVIPPFITLVTSSESEVQYVVLRTLSLFVLKYPKALVKEIRVFFCKYNDPSYIKMEKLDIIVTICNTRSTKLVLDELMEYCNAVDVAFVRKSIRAIGQIAIKIEASSRRCVDILVELVKGKADYAIEEAVCVVTDILRKFPGEFESIISSVCQNIENIKEPRAKAAAIWILGEYCHIIDNVDTILDPFLDTFHDEQPVVQLQLLTSMVKVYLDKPESTKDQLQFVLNEATKDGNYPDVKNRAFVYWRVLSADPEIAKKVVVFSKETLVHSGVSYDENVLGELIKNMGTVAGVLHVVPSDFVRRVRYVPEEDEVIDDGGLRDWKQLRMNDSSKLDMFIDYDPSNIYLRIANKVEEPVSDLAFALNKNAIGMSISGQISFPQSIPALEFIEVSIPIIIQLENGANFDKPEMQMALKSSFGTFYAVDRIPVEFLFDENGNKDPDTFRSVFASSSDEITAIVENASIADQEQLAERNIFFIGQNQNKVYASFGFQPNNYYAVELTQEGENINCLIKSNQPKYLQVISSCSRNLFSQK